MIESEFGTHHLSLSQEKSTRNLTPLSIGFVKLQFLFDIKKFSVKLLIVGIVAVFVGAYNCFLLEKTGLYSLGITSIFQSIARCTSYFLKKSKFEASAKAIHSIMFWVMSLIMNIPLAIFGYRKIGKRFAILTVFYVVISSVVSIFISSIFKSSGAQNFYLFSDPRTFNSCLISENINILQWNYISTIQQGATNIAMNDSSRIALIFWYGLCFGLLNTATSLIIYAIGGSTGGMDWIIFHFTKKKKRVSPNIYLYIGLIITFVSYVIGTYLPYVDHMSSCSNTNSSFNTDFSVVSNLLGPTLVATAIAAVTRRICFSLFYPHFKFIHVKIFTNKVLEFRKLLLSANFPHSFTITSSVGGYLLQRQMVFEVTCLALEYKTLKETVEKIDPSCLIIATSIKSLNGKFLIRDNLS